MRQKVPDAPESFYFSVCEGSLHKYTAMIRIKNGKVKFFPFG